MFGHRTLHRHAAMMNRMAEVQGLNLTEAMAQGVLSGEDWREAVVACTGCRDPEGCLHWLAGCPAPEPGDRQQTAAATPDFCANRALLAQLRATALDRELLTAGQGADGCPGAPRDVAFSREGV